MNETSHPLPRRAGNMRENMRYTLARLQHHVGACDDILSRVRGAGRPSNPGMSRPATTRRNRAWRSLSRRGFLEHVRRTHTQPLKLRLNCPSAEFTPNPHQRRRPKLQKARASLSLHHFEPSKLRVHIVRILVCSTRKFKNTGLHNIIKQLLSLCN